MPALRTHFAAGLLALILALLASPPAADARGAKSHAPALDGQGVLIPSWDALDPDDDDDQSSPGGEPSESGESILSTYSPQLGLDLSGRVDLARSYQGISPARHLRRGGHSPPRCPP